MTKTLKNKANNYSINEAIYEQSEALCTSWNVSPLKSKVMLYFFS